MTKLSFPFTEEKIRALKVGDEVLISGVVHTGRDAVHKYLHEGGALPPSRSFLAPGRFGHGTERGLEDAVTARAREHEQDDLRDVLRSHHSRERIRRSTASVIESEVRRHAAWADVGTADSVLA